MNDPQTSPPRQMTRERWERLSPLVDAVLDQPPRMRLAYVAEISGGDATLAKEVMRFVEACGDAGTDKGDDSIFGPANHEVWGFVSARLFDPSTDLSAQLQASLGSRYVIEGEIGGGGMSRVFVAEEPGLERKVVIKVLPPELTEGISAERFGREIKLAASLQQANIVPVLAAGSAAEFSFYVMPFVEGRSLRHRLLRDGALSINDAIGILRDVARALVFAHGRGVIHRDIKPANILLSDRTAVVTDFGIAKALGVARGGGQDGTRDEALSQAGTGIGTPAYMAPEQAASDPNVDDRADIYSFGCVAYELLTGKPPFTGAAPHHIIAAHFRERPRPVTELRREVPPAVAQLVERCLEKDPSRRPQSADEVLLALDGAARDPVTYRPRHSRATVAVAAVALLTAALAGVTYYTSASRQAKPLRFAVVPFRNLTRDTSLDYRSDGIGDEILNGLAKVRGVQIVGRSTAFRYKYRAGVDAPDVQTIERLLGAQLLLTGTLRDSDGRIIVSAQLNDSTSRGEIWSDSFTRGSSDLGSTTDEIVRRVSETLRAKFGSRIGSPRPMGSIVGTANPEALDHYLIGQAQMRRRGSGIRQSIQSFQQAIDRDANFARARASLALALELQPFFSGTPPRAFVGRAVREARLALALDSTLADAYVALGVADGFAARWDSSDAEMRHAIELEPDNAMARQTFARQLIVRGYADEGIEQLERARTVEPTSPLLSAWLSYAFFLDGRTDSAVAEMERASQLDSTLLVTQNLGSLLSLALGKPAAARRLIGVPGAGEMSNAPYVFAKLGDTARANRLVREMERNTPRPWFVDVDKASILLATGDSAGALAAMERSARQTGALWVYFIPLRDPAFDVVRRSPRFAALLRQANIDLRIVRNPRGGS